MKHDLIHKMIKCFRKQKSYVISISTDNLYSLTSGGDVQTNEINTLNKIKEKINAL